MTVPKPAKETQTTPDPREELASLVFDLEAHLAWRKSCGATRLPPPARQAVSKVKDETGRLQKSEPEAPPRSADTAKGEAVEAPSAPSTPSGGLEAVREELGDCRRCRLFEGRKNIVFGVGSPQADLVFVGEGPGGREDALGEPFVGAAGQLLDRMIAAMGYSRDDVYICNVVKCRPPNNRDPRPDEVAACEPFLKKQLATLDPKVIVGLGRFAVQCLLGDPGASIVRVRGNWSTYEEIDLMPTFHPAYLLRNPTEKRNVWEDLKQVMARLGRPGL